MARLHLLGLLICFIYRSDATRCFQCQNVAFPRDCTKVIECSSDEDCVTEQVIKTDGHFVYNTGCIQRSLCAPTGVSLIGRRSSRTKRATDIKTCIQCCKDDFCNNRGCGTNEIPLDQRGPYCFTCNATDDAKTCDEVSVCSKNEVCMLYSPAKYNNIPKPVYKGQCETRSVCDMTSRAMSNTRCTPTCCTADFCNDHCGISSSNVTVTTSHQQTTHQMTRTSEILSTQTTHSTKPAVQPTQLLLTTQATHRPTLHTTKADYHCNRHGHYILLQNAHAHLCVHIVLHHVHWTYARDRCKQEGGDLVVLDTYEKALLLRNKLAETVHSGYWIGARDFNHDNHFLWVNNHRFDNSKADWAGGQPDHFHFGENQNCVIMEMNSYQWHDKFCLDTFNYICERRS